MKILHVISLGYVAGGAENSVVTIKAELERRGHEVRVFSSDAPGEPRFTDYTFATIATGTLRTWAEHLFHRNAYHALRAAIADFEPDVVHFHTLGSCSPSVLFAVAGTPAVLTIHGPEEFTKGLMLWIMPIGDFRGEPYTRAGLNLVGRARYWYYRLLQRPIYRRGLRRLSAVIAPSRYILKATVGDFSPVPVHHIPNGIDLPSSRELPPELSVLFVGRLVPVKGVDILLRAFAVACRQEPQARLRVLGDGAARDRYVALADELQIADRVTFAGWVSREQMAEEYSRASIVAVPSNWPENFPTVCIEAMAYGRPVIATATGGIPELVDPGRTGLIVPMNDEHAFAEALVELLGDPERRTAMGKAAGEAAREFEVERFADRLLATYANIARHG